MQIRSVTLHVIDVRLSVMSSICLRLQAHSYKQIRNIYTFHAHTDYTRAAYTIYYCILCKLWTGLNNYEKYRDLETRVSRGH